MAGPAKASQETVPKLSKIDEPIPKYNSPNPNQPLEGFGEFAQISDGPQVYNTASSTWWRVSTIYAYRVDLLGEYCDSGNP